MRQQTLRLPLPERYDYHAWVRHAGVEAACNRLALWIVHGGMLWLTSSSVAGKTHLIRLLRHEHPTLALIEVDASVQSSSLALVRQWHEHLQDAPFWAVDVQAAPLPRGTQLALFHLIERARDMHRPLLLSWRVPAETRLPPELSTRLRGVLERVEMAPPSRDGALHEILLSAARSWQWEVEPRVLETLLHTLPRRLDILLAGLRHLEECTRLHRKPHPGRGWVREQLQQWLARSAIGDPGA
ncbi:MAG: glucose-inhibited division protein A [Zetaproteobacteria bacterium]|nr:MAG: glucose-inhibited division protein A [Zetaproteobacteria bacterium]